MKKLLLILLCLPLIGFGQNLDGYKYATVGSNYEYSDGTKDTYGVANQIANGLSGIGIRVISDYRQKWPKDALSNPCLVLSISWHHSAGGLPHSANAGFSITNCNGSVLYSDERFSTCFGCYYQANIKNATRKSLKGLSSRYRFNSSLTPEMQLPDVELTHETESSLTSYYDSNILHDIEGIYKSNEENGNSYTLGIKKYGRLFKAIIIKADYKHWKDGEVKIILNQTATKDLYSCSYFLGNKQKKELFLIVENSGLLTFKIDDKNTANFIKMYPVNTGVSNGRSSGEWGGNGSGFFISQNGYIVTNHHVIEKASEIEVEFKYRNEIKGFSAKVIQTDAINDLAILKIDDDDFSNVGALPYTFRTRSVDVGTDVFALGYPKALTIMGKEIKFTDGRISSKTGFKGDITTYQSTTPIQPGNSGGPLFDFKGNLIGINNAKIITEDVEGVSYSIKSSYLLNLIDVLPETIPLPSSTQLASKPLTEQIKILSDYVVLIKVK